MILITYWTDEHFSENTGEKHYCKNLWSARDFIVNLMELKEEQIENIEFVKYDIKVLEYNMKVEKNASVNISCPYDNLYIKIEHITLI